MPTMEFWGAEVSPGAGHRVPAAVDYLMHLSQAALGESKNKAESVTLYVKCGDQQLVLGTLSHQNLPQMSFDLVFEKEFELSHNWKNGSVHFCGYKAEVPTPDYPFEDELEGESESESEEEMVPAAVTENGKPKTEAQNANSVNANAAKPDSAKQNVKITEPSKDQKSKDDDDDEEDESDEEDDSENEFDSDDENIDEMSVDESSEEDAEETPVKAEVSKDVGKKRSSESVTKTPQAKKAKSATPEKTDGKKGGHTATPHPAKKAGKAAAQTPKSGGQTKCNSCSKTFNSEQALQSHSKAKHGGK